MDGTMADETSLVSLDSVRERMTRAMDGTIGVKNPPSEVLDGAFAVAKDAVGLLQKDGGGLDQEAFDELEKELPADLRAWLLELPSFLAKKGREESGMELCGAYSPLLGEAHLDAERAVVLFEAGKKDEALQHLAKCEDQYAKHHWVALRGAFVYENTGDIKKARSRYENAVEWARESGDRKDLRFAYDGLIQFLQDHNEQGQAVELGRQMLEELPEIEEEFRTEQIVNTAPKVGRNDPCPCGSGKKFKKCCGK